MVRQRLGQHFLIDDEVARREVAYASLRDDEVVLEIGPGRGILTRLLAQQARQVVAIELDARLLPSLKRNLPGNVTVVHADAVSVDFLSLPCFQKVVSNLPFQISSPITFKLLGYPFSKAVLIYQKDFADRLVASPGTRDYSRLSVGVFYRARCRILEEVPRGCFSPQPRVDSCIVELVPRKKVAFEVADEPFFFEVTRQLFNHRRKKIRQAIRLYYGDYPGLPYLDERVEDLTPAQIGELSTALWSLR